MFNIIIEILERFVRWGEHVIEWIIDKADWILNKLK